MELRVWCQTDVGHKREINQDSFLIDESLGLYVVADGMGGHRGGEVASAMAVETVQEIVSQHWDRLSPKTVKQTLNFAYAEASRRIFDKSRREPEEHSGMGTTLVAALRCEGVLYIGNVGDSRAYYYCDPYLWQLTEDHSLVNEQIRAGLMNEDGSALMSPKNIITRSVGYERDVQCDITEKVLSVEDLFLICSDGLTGLVSDEEIADICHRGPVTKIVPRCIDRAKAGGGDDNITVMAIKVTES